MNKLRSISVLFLSLGFPIQGAQCATIKLVDLKDGDFAITVAGAIEPGDDKKFNNIATTLDKAIVVLDSPGGATIAAIEIGKTVRLKGFATAVFNGYSCNSACSLIWLAGNPRSMARSAKIGFHASYVDVRGNLQESGVGNAIVGRYLTLLNLSERALIFATEQSPTKLNWLTSKNLASSGIDANIVEDFQEKETELSPPPIVQNPGIGPKTAPTFKWKSVGSWDVMVDRTLGYGCFMIATWEGGTAVRIGFDKRSDKKYYIIFGNKQWKSLRLGDIYNINIKFGSEEPWDIKGTARDINGMPGFFVDFSEEQFWRELDRNNSVEMSYNGKNIANLTLQDSQDAHRELYKCQAAQPIINEDPFRE